MPGGGQSISRPIGKATAEAAHARTRARLQIIADTPRSISRSRLSADNGRPRVFAALITVSNAECGKKDGDECAAELVTDGGSGDPLCQSRESPIAESLAPPAKQQSAKQQSAHTRHIAHHGRHISRGRIPRSRAPARFVKLAGDLSATAARNHVATGMQIRAITGRDAAISRSAVFQRDPVSSFVVCAFYFARVPPITAITATIANDRQRSTTSLPNC